MATIDESLQKIPLKDIAKTPFAYALYVVTMVLLGVIGGQRLDSITDKADWGRERTELQEQVKTERKEKDEVFKAYLVERGVNQQIQKTVDSTAIQKYKTK
ncbi:hypothetical protein OQZ33_04425 [Pedobacter sp. MC2016-05]|uniref:hypothetical protein n=1 Tax=Pedobacter sp. MC2016-05 TaxID=2994474 RepID=UPI0022483635|nr:hypothetical protein [Pedobacter sp. MC2016-05]MCX2473572.1 hypothetical protein [Pedobacter sp. MC2016-05]